MKNYNFATHNKYPISLMGLGRGENNINTAPRAENFFGFQAEFEQNKGIRAEPGAPWQN